MNNIMEILDKLQFFGGQRAGRELWADKPTDVQDADIDSFNENIDAIRYYIQQLGEDKARLESTITQLSGTVKHLRDAESRVPRWISVEERLPEKGERVLVTNGPGGKFVCESYLNIQGKWMRAGAEMFFMEPHFWMPMPEPPKE